MSLPYSTSPHAWRFVLILHRLAALAQDTPLRIMPAGKSSLNTARAKLFQGRMFILSTHEVGLARYAKLALASAIHTYDTRLEITKTDAFDAIYGDLPADDFTNIYRCIQAELNKLTKTFGFPFGEGIFLTTPQVKALKEFLLNCPAVKYVNVTHNSVMVTK